MRMREGQKVRVPLAPFRENILRRSYGTGFNVKVCPRHYGISGNRLRWLDIIIARNNSRSFTNVQNLVVPLPRIVAYTGGGGGTSYVLHIGYGPRERPPLLTRNFRSGAHHFHKWQKLSVPEHHHFVIARQILHFCRSGDHRFQNFFSFKP